jgi:hypothetical protein
MFPAHCGPLHRVDHDRGRIRGAVRPATGRLHPVVMLGRHQYECAPTTTCDFNRLAAGALLKRAELAAELQDRRRGHGIDWQFDSFRMGRYDVGDVKLCE